MSEGSIENATLIEIYQDYLIPFAPAGPMGPAIVEGKGAKVVDEEGESYIDLEAGPGVSNVGHCHPKIVAAIARQAGKLIHSPGRYFSHLQVSLARRLSRMTGGLLEKTFFANSGAEAVDGAVKLALKHAIATGKKGLGIIALQYGFHGRLSLPLTLTGVAERKVGFGPYATFPGVVHAPAPYCYRCPLGLTYPSCGVKCADTVGDILKTSVPGEAAIMIAEPILAVGGVIVPPDEYWPKISNICSEHSISLILDEVFTGFGRTGKFFAFQHWNLRPHIVTFAKAAGSGIPLGGFIAIREIAEAFQYGDHTTTMGSSNHVGLAAAHAVLDVIDEEGLVEAAAKRGRRLVDGLRALADRHPAIGDVRGLGLMIGAEIVADAETRDPAADLTNRIQEGLRERGVLVSIAGVHHNVLRFTPPLVVTDQEIDTSLEKLDAVLSALST